MSEVDARPPPTRGRSSFRGGRGGFGRGGPRGSRKTVNGTNHGTVQVEESLEDQGELGEMKKKYASEVGMLKDMFPDWTDADLVFALQDADGDVAATVDRITQGSVSQFAEVKSTKERARSKVKEPTSIAVVAEKPTTRAGRGRGGFEGTRGSRGRGSDRGRGGLRGGRGGHATLNAGNEAAKEPRLPLWTTETTSWDHAHSVGTSEGSAHEAAKDAGDTGQSTFANVITAESTPAGASEGAKSSLIPESGPKKSWASMFAPKPVPVPATGKAPAPQPLSAELLASSQAPLASKQKPGATKVAEPIVPLPIIQGPHGAVPPAVEELPPEPPRSVDGEELALTPSKHPLTEENVEHLPDESHPPATHTSASTAGSIDPRNLTPLPGQQAPIARPPLGGYATAAHRATGMAARSASYQRRVQEQQEAVVMPGHNAVNQAAVQFGSMGLNGEPGPDVDEDREEPETRQAPQHSPPSQPRTSLPPAPRQMVAPQEPIMADIGPTPKQAPGLPPASSQNQQQMQDATLAPGIPNDPAQMSHNYNQYGRYTQPVMQPESAAPQQTQYDRFGHQAQHSQYELYGGQSQPPQSQQQTQAGYGAVSSATNDYSSYYTTDQQRSAYNNYYGSTYGPQDVRSQVGPGQHDAGMGQQRSASGLGASSNDSAFASQAHQQAQSRFADAPGSGQNTPNPLLAQQQQQQTAPAAQQSQHSMHQAPGHQQPGGYGGGGYPYGQYYNGPYPQAYQNQYGFSNQLGGYGGGYPAKHSMYGGSHGYGMGPQSSYDQHSASPANASAFGQNQQASMRSASGMNAGLSGLEDHGRSSAQSHQQSTGYGGINDPFARTTSGFGGQNAYGQQSMAGPEDSLKPFAEGKSGPSPALGQPGRPGSAANSAAGSAQSGLPPPQAGFGGYAGFPSQNQYGGLGGLGTQQQQQQQQHGQSSMAGQGGYGSYTAGGGFSQTYGGYNSRGGWGSNYGAH